MNKIALALFLVLDLAVLSIATSLLLDHAGVARMPWLAPIKAKIPTAGSPNKVVTGSPASRPAAPTNTTTSTPASSPAGPGVMAGSAQRNIMFRYRDPKAKKVEVRIEFEGWRGTPMAKDANGNWNYTAVASVPAGEYGYYFVVDDKPVSDPVNKKTKRVGRTTFSAVEVKPLPQP